jgi:hypothetical protein
MLLRRPVSLTGLPQGRKYRYGSPARHYSLKKNEKKMRKYFGIKKIIIFAL